MIDTNKHYRMIIFLIVYGPYRDIFDIFINQFRKNWPDCPYPLVIGNEYYKIYEDNILTMDFPDGTTGTDRLRHIIDTIDADYYLGFEADRVLMDKVKTDEVEKILDFMDQNNIQYYRCHSSIVKKKPEDRYDGYAHYYHIPANEPYGVPGSTAIWSKGLRQKIRNRNMENGYIWESYQNKRAAHAKEKWLDLYATDDRNLFNILHCIEKQKWIRSAYRSLKKAGYDLSNNTRKKQTILETIEAKVKEFFKRIPGKTRYRIKKLFRRLGFKFSTDY